MYSKAQGVERDAAEAAKWYWQAAEQGNLTAIFLAGSLYLSGEGVEQDLVQAYMRFAVAAALGPQDAQETASRNRSQRPKRWRKTGSRLDRTTSAVSVKL